MKYNYVILLAKYIYTTTRIDEFVFKSLGS